MCIKIFSLLQHKTNIRYGARPFVITEWIFLMIEYFLGFPLWDRVFIVLKSNKCEFKYIINDFIIIFFFCIFDSHEAKDFISRSHLKWLFVSHKMNKLRVFMMWVEVIRWSSKSYLKNFMVVWLWLSLLFEKGVSVFKLLSGLL